MNEVGAFALDLALVVAAYTTLAAFLRRKSGVGESAQQLCPCRFHVRAIEVVDEFNR